MPADEVTVSANYEELTESDTEQEEEKPVREVVAPIASILSGTYTSDQRIELSTPTDGADIYYTLTMDGSEPSTPDESSIKYSNAIEVNGQAGSVVQIKIKAIAMKDKMQNSVVSEFTYIIDIPVVKYIITASAGENGYISPSGQVEVEEGSSQTFLITAEEGYEIEEIKVDGTDVAISTAYTFDNVTEDHSIAVTFKKATETPEESVVEAPCITVQPIDVSVKEGEMATFTIKATGTDLVYQWQIDRNDGNGWGNLVTEKAKEASYTTAIINKNCDGFKYRCVVSNSIGSLTSKEVLLTVQDSKIDQEDELTKPEEEIKGSEDSETEEEIIDTEDSETEEEIANTEDSETEEEIVDQEDSETEEEIVEPSENTTESEEEIVNTEESMTEFDKEIIDSEKTTIKSEASMVESEESITDSEKIVGEMGESTMESKESTSEMRESTTESEMSTVDKNNKTSETSTGDKLPMVWLYVLLIVSGVVLTGLGIKKKTMVRR